GAGAAKFGTAGDVLKGDNATGKLRGRAPLGLRHLRWRHRDLDAEVRAPGGPRHRRDGPHRRVSTVAAVVRDLTQEFGEAVQRDLGREGATVVTPEVA